MKLLSVELQSKMVSILYKLMFVAVLLILSVVLEKWQSAN